MNVKNRYGVTPLVLAATTGSAPVTQALINAGAYVKAVAPETGSVLSIAACTGSPEVIKQLLAAGADANFAEVPPDKLRSCGPLRKDMPKPSKRSWRGSQSGNEGIDQGTALFYAVRKGDITSVGALLAAGADVNTRTAPETPGNGRGEAATKAYRVRPKYSPFGDSMLVVAIMNNNFDIADLLLNKGADPNAAGIHWTPLHALVRIRNYEETQFPAPKGTGTLDSLEFARRLLAHGANPGARPQPTPPGVPRGSELR